MTSISLPWPPKELLPNHRSKTHWGRTAKTKTARMLAFGEAVRALGGISQAAAYAPESGDIAIRLGFEPPAGRGRPRDEDANAASCKAYLDGLADALRVNDSRFRQEKPQWLPKQGAGRIIIEF